MHTSTLEIDLCAFRNNLKVIQKEAQTPLLVVLKANAYGHGLAKMGRCCEECDVRYVGVVQLQELAELRGSGYSGRALVMGGVFDEDIDRVHELDGDLAVWSYSQLQAANDAGRKLGRRFRLHLKIDTGMGRLGILPKEIDQLAQAIGNCDMIEVAGVYSHFASADADDKTKARAQLHIFGKAVNRLRDFGINPEYRHLANSPAALGIQDSHFDLVRIGIAAYGLKPTPSFALPEGVKPIAMWKTRILAKKILPAGHGVSYGAEYVMEEAGSIAVLPIGYADGYRRYPGNVNTVLYRGSELPIRGRVCMDYCMVDISLSDNARVGDEVVLIGQSEGRELTADALAVRWGTNNYDVLVGIGGRVARVYNG